MRMFGQLSILVLMKKVLGIFFLAFEQRDNFLANHFEKL